MVCPCRLFYLILFVPRLVVYGLMKVSFNPSRTHGDIAIPSHWDLLRERAWTFYFRSVLNQGQCSIALVFIRTALGHQVAMIILCSELFYPRIVFGALSPDVIAFYIDFEAMMETRSVSATDRKSVM